MRVQLWKETNWWLFTWSWSWWCSRPRAWKHFGPKFTGKGRTYSEFLFNLFRREWIWENYLWWPRSCHPTFNTLFTHRWEIVCILYNALGLLLNLDAISTCSKSYCFVLHANCFSCCSNAYIVGVESFCVGSLCLKETRFQALIDSGSSFTFLPNEVYQKVVIEVIPFTINLVVYGHA